MKNKKIGEKKEGTKNCPQDKEKMKRKSLVDHPDKDHKGGETDTDYSNRPKITGSEEFEESTTTHTSS